MSLKQKVILTKAFIETQCGYYSLIWILYEIGAFDYLHECSIIKKQSSRAVLKKRFSENMQQI